MKSATTQAMPRGAGCALMFLSAIALGMGSLLADMLIFEPIRKGRQSETWESVPCIIRELSVKTHSVKSRRRSDSPGYSPEVKFEYSYHGKSYVSRTFWFSNQLLGTKEEAKELIGQYKIGSESTCWVNPSQPDQAVLNREHSGVSLIGGGFGILFAMIGGLGLFGTAWLCLKPRR